jgi:hypothetical protein
VLDELLVGLLAVLSEMHPAGEAECGCGELRTDARLRASGDLSHLTKR